MGVATTNDKQRALARFGLLDGGVAPSFDAHKSVANGGVLFLLPALLSQGLMTIKDTHSIKEGYYGIESIILTLAYMVLCRIKNPEQLKQCSPGDLGKLMGLDRIPEIKCLRTKMGELFDAKMTKTLNERLAIEWIKTTDDNLFLYTDGHVKIYNGAQANLTKKFISRQKLCLAATADFWLNDAQGLPLMVWTGELNEKLSYMMEQEMIPNLISSGMIKVHEDKKALTPICTLVFDREAYEPKFFARLLDLYRIAIISYRKNVKNKWAESDFAEYVIENKAGEKITMLLAEKPIVLNGIELREIRCLASREHQTALITNHPTLSMEIVAPTLFNRWQQENFFKYMIADYSLDHMVEYGTETIDLNALIVNPAHRAISYQIKKATEKLNRLKASLLKTVKLNTTAQLEDFQKSVKAKSTLVEQIEIKEEELKKLKEERKKLEPKIKLGTLPEAKRITKLKTESAYFMSTLKMICYRAETAVANLLNGIYERFVDEKRMFIKNIISTPVDLIPDLKENTLTIKLHTLSTPKRNEITAEICKLLNETETIYPGTNLKLIYKTAIC